jgi:hypothetical protein
MLSKIIQFVKVHQADIILLIGVILISLLSFLMGYITAKLREKEPIKIDYESSYHWGGNFRAVSGLEIS